MAVVTKYYMTRKDGVVLNHSYSDLGPMIERDGVQYREAVDPAGLGRAYTEVPGTEEEMTDAEALEFILGGAV